MRTHEGVTKAIGPGVLYAAAAVGAAELVQSTRAGADYGLALIGLIALTFVAKYPAFRFGAQYACATGQSLLDGYRRQGHWAVALYIVIAIGTMFAAVPAVTLVTAGLARVAFGLETGTMTISFVILGGGLVLLATGGYRVLDRFTKVLMVLLALSTLIATALVIPRIDWSDAGGFLPPSVAGSDVFFMVALLGMMPSSVDISVWHSLWSVARAEDSRHRPSLRESLLDYHLGYVGSFVIAVCFVLLGTGLMYHSDIEFVADATGFSMQLIELYKATLGEWSGPLMAFVAMAVMFTTVLTGLDGYPRAAVGLYCIYTHRTASADTSAAGRAVYIAALTILAAGSALIMYFFVTSLRMVVDFASTLLFLFAPIAAWLNHRAILGADFPPEFRPGRWLIALSWVGIFSLAAFSAWFLYLRFLA